MRIRLPFAGIFFLLCLLAGYAGLSSLQVDAVVNDKVLHVVTFFLLTVVFYWIIDTNRRRTLNLTLVVCTLVLGVGSEFLQGFLPNGRSFDLYDIVANVVGSLAGLALCSWYHMRMLERKRQRRQYNAVPGEDEADIELGEGADVGQQEEGVMSAAGNERTTILEQEVDNWDENAVDAWDDEDVLGGDIGARTVKGPEQNGVGDDSKKRV
ncbi:VanZ domain protein, partial [Biscogniauxia marginata]